MLLESINLNSKLVGMGLATPNCYGNFIAFANVVRLALHFTKKAYRILNHAQPFSRNGLHKTWLIINQAELLKENFMVIFRWSYLNCFYYRRSMGENKGLLGICFVGRRHCWSSISLILRLSIWLVCSSYPINLLASLSVENCKRI